MGPAGGPAGNCSQVGVQDQSELEVIKIAGERRRHGLAYCGICAHRRTVHLCVRPGGLGTRSLLEDEDEDEHSRLC